MRATEASGNWNEMLIMMTEGYNYRAVTTGHAEIYP
jgi:hypothetical protein